MTAREVARDLVERCARIMGPQSAAASALAFADTLPGGAAFFLDHGQWVVVDDALIAGVSP